MRAATSQEELQKIVFQYAKAYSIFGKIKKFISDWQKNYLDKDFGEYPENLKNYQRKYANR